jgi:hypothetical protein
VSLPDFWWEDESIALILRETGSQETDPVMRLKSSAPRGKESHFPCAFLLFIESKRRFYMPENAVDNVLS